MAELRPRSFRIDEETADKFRKIGESIGANQQETLERLIQAYELQIGKSNLTERKADMEKFEGYVAILNRMYMNSLEENQHITDVVRESFEDALKSKDQTIQDLQQQKKAAEETKQQVTAEAKKATDEADQLRKELEETQKRCNELTADKETFTERNEELKADRSRLEAEVKALKEAQQQMEALRKELEATKEAKAAAEKQLKEAQAAGKKALEDLKMKMEVSQERAVLEAEKSLRKEHEEQIREINQKYMELIAGRIQTEEVSKEK